MDRSEYLISSFVRVVSLESVGRIFSIGDSWVFRGVVLGSVALNRLLTFEDTEALGALSLIFMMGLDLVSGLIAAHKKRVAWSPLKMWDFFLKFLLFFCVGFAAHLLDVQVLANAFAGKLVAVFGPAPFSAFVLVVMNGREALSILKNARACGIKFPWMERILDPIAKGDQHPAELVQQVVD